MAVEAVDGIRVVVEVPVVSYIRLGRAWQVARRKRSLSGTVIRVGLVIVKMGLMVKIQRLRG